MMWYAAQVLTGREGDVQQRLTQKDFTVRIPMERRSIHRRGSWQDVETILMPGYVFIGTERLTDTQYYRIRRVPGVIRLLGSPTPISSREAAFWCLEGSGTPLTPSVLTVDAGGRATVLRGPLLGREADIVWINRRRRLAGVRMHTPDGEKVIKFCVLVQKPVLPPGWAAQTQGQETGDNAGSIHSPAASPADIDGRPGGA